MPGEWPTRWRLGMTDQTGLAPLPRFRRRTGLHGLTPCSCHRYYWSRPI